MPVIQKTAELYGVNTEIINPRMTTYVVPNITIKANSIKLLNKDGTPDLELNKPYLKIRILPLISGRIHINKFSAKNIGVNLTVKDKIYLGSFPLEFSQGNLKTKVNKVKIDNFALNVDDNSEIYKVTAKDLYFKNKRKAFVLKGKSELIAKNNKACANLDIYLPHNKNLKKTKFDIDLKNLDLAVFTDLVHKGIYDEITSLSGVINLDSDDKNLVADLKRVNIEFQDKNKSMIFPDDMVIKSNYKIGKDSFNIHKMTVDADRISAQMSGTVNKIFSNNPKTDLVVNIDKSDIRKGALLLPPVVTPDISIPKLKEYPFYGNIWGKLRIKGKLPEPDITGNIKVSDGVLIKPLPNATGNATVNIDFIGKQLVLDVIVPAGGREIVYVSGDVMIYGDKYAHLKVKSSKNVCLDTAEFVVNPLHEILCFVIGPVPIMDISGTGNVDIKIEGTKKDPHIWGEFHFYDTSARFLEINNLVLEHASGDLEFNNQHAHFINKTGTLHGQPATIDGVCTLFGDLDFNATANNQNLSDLLTILTTSPMLKDIKGIVPDVTDAKGKADFYLNLRGKLLDINDLKINENVIPKGNIKLLGNSVKMQNIPINGIKGIINYDKKDCDFDLKAMISSASQSTINGVIKDNKADLKIDSPRIRVNELDPKLLHYLDPLTIRLKAHYKGKVDTPEIGGIDALIEVIKDNRPVKNGKIISGKIVLDNSNLLVSNLRGIIKQDPFSLNLNARNIGKEKLNLSKAVVNGDFTCKDFDLTTINLIAKAKILPADIQKELNKLNMKSGKANINAKARHSRLNADADFKETEFEYTLYSGKNQVNVPVRLISGQLGVRNNTVNINRVNGLIDGMPVLLFGKVDNIYSNPQYKINLNSKLVQRVFDKYWNANNIYPVKMNGDILYSSVFEGNKSHLRMKSDIKMEENSNIYYMGATIGDSLNPITVNIDTDIDKNGWIKINKFNYNKLIASQNNKHNVLPLLSINGQIKSVGKIYELRNLVVKTENPANANFFNIIFKKPTIKRGNFTSDLRINGTSNRPKIIGKLNANNLEMPYLNTTVKDIVVDFKPNVIQVTTKGEVLDNYIMVNANLKNCATPPYKVNEADIYINDFDIDNSWNLFKQMELKGFSSAFAPDTDAAGSEIINSLVMDNVRIRAGNVKVRNIKASNLDAVCSLNNRMRMAVDSFRFNMASGIMTGKLSYNLLNNFMQMELDAKGVNANELVYALFDLSGQIYGSLTGHIELSCNAVNDKTRLETLSGFGSFNVVNGRMPKLGSLEYLLRAGNLIKGGITGLSMNGIIDVITPMKTGDFSSIDGRIRLKDGIAKTLEIRSLGKNLNLYLIGSLNLTNQVADMHVYGQLSKKISTILGAAGNISLNTLFNKIPGISLSGDNQLVNELNKIPGIELSNKSNRRFMVEILGDINGENFVKSFKWIN
ncbi:MAG: DUF3971 domain-containing protein [Cyanobacteria bacterium RUI128]|nr:DUF3971 domain-containing protein [Cyanobacteria bacterium RUI128]